MRSKFIHSFLLSATPHTRVILRRLLRSFLLLVRDGERQYHIFPERVALHFSPRSTHVKTSSLTASLSRSSTTRAAEYSIGITSDTLESFIFLSQYNDDASHNMLRFACADAREASVLCLEQ
jgi:hypothetical protein